MGVKFVSDDGKESIKLDALPLPNEKGEVWMNVFEQKPREDAATGTWDKPEDKSDDTASKDFNDEIPSNKPKVPRVTPFATRGITKRLRGSKIIYEQRDELAMDLLGLYSAKVTDVVDIVHREDGSTSVDLKDVGDIPENALRAIRKIKVTPTRHGEQVEVEMIDKVRIGQMLAKSAGLLDNEKEIDKPGVVSIEMVMPKEDGDE